jgi:hypothetical protein
MEVDRYAFEDAPRLFDALLEILESAAHLYRQRPLPDERVNAKPWLSIAKALGVHYRRTQAVLASEEVRGTPIEIILHEFRQSLLDLCGHTVKEEGNLSLAGDLGRRFQRDRKAFREAIVRCRSKARELANVDWNLEAEPRKHGVPTMDEAAQVVMGSAVLPAPPHAAKPPASDIEIKNFGDVWTLTWQGRTVNVRGTVGLSYIQILLSRPNEGIRCLDLVSLATGKDPSDPRMAALTVTDDHVLDPTAVRAAEDRLSVIKAEFEEAVRTHNIERQEELDIERKRIESALEGSRGIRGKSRVLSTPEEKARKAVGRAIGRGIEDIRGVWPELASQLDDCVERGACCRYTPLLHGA